MKIKNIKKKMLAKLLLMTLPISCYMIYQTLPAYAEDASNNTKTVNESNYDGGNIYAGETTSGEASNNNLTVSDVDASSANQIDAGLTYEGDSNNNITNINNVNASSGFIHGGYAIGTGNAEYNIVNFNGGTVYHLHGGHAVYGDALYNKVNFFDGNVTNVIGGGFTDYGNSNYNTLNIYGGTIEGTAYGGTYYGSSSTGDAIGNTVNIYGGEITGDVYGGWAPNGSANDNTINVYGSPKLEGATLHAGSAANAMTGNSLNIYTKKITAQNIDGFQDLNYYFPSDLTNGDTILTLTNGSTDLSNTTININSAGGSNLNTGDTFTLLQNDNGITVSNVTNSGVISEGISLDYGLTIPEIESATTSNSSSSHGYMERNDEESLTKITAVVGDLQSDGLKEQTKLLNNTVQAGVILAQAGEERIVNWLPPEDDYKDIDIIDIDPHNEFRIFANANFSSLKIKTGEGSFTRSRSGGMDVGFAKAVESSSGNKLVFAPIFDYGAGNYDSYLRDGMHGHGTSNYYAGGFIFRKMNKKSGFYYEASARLGRARSNFFSRDFMAGNSPVDVSYSVSAPLYAGHIHIGQLYPINRENTFQVYGQYFHTHQSGMDTTLSSGEDYNFDSIDSGRARIGVRLIREAPNKKNRFYSGLAYQYEFNGDSIGHYKDYSTSKSNMKGSSGMLEFGWQLKPSNKSPWMLDLNTVGWIGYQKGVTLQAKFKRAV